MSKRRIPQFNARLGVVLTLGLLLLSGCAGGGSLSAVVPSQQQGIWVTGIGKVRVVPDVATVSLGIESQESTVALAQARAAEAMGRVVDALKTNGVAERDIQTQFFNIQRVTRFDRDKEQEVVIGYRVTNIVTARLRDIPRAGATVDAVAVAGGDLTRVNSIAFSIDDPSRYESEARDRAMADAKSKAQQLARLGGVGLGKATFISETTFQPPPIPIFRGLEAAAAAPDFPPTPISPGETEITLSIQVVYDIS